MKDPWIGIDIGGANLKAAHSSGWTNSCTFPMWKQYRSLAISIATLLADAPAFCGVAVTMTGELADCFATRAEGVAVILEQVTSVLPSAMVRVYCVDGSWLSVAQAARKPWDVAASNWHGLARFAQRFATSDACMLIDVGSTTTDIIPLTRKGIAMQVRTDSQRLQSGSLVYTGVERSNTVGIVRELTLHEQSCPVMNELFATALDVYVWLGLAPESPNNRDTADQQPATMAGARHRLARMVGEDGSTLTDRDIDLIANQIYQAQASMIAKGIQQVASIFPQGVQGKRPSKKSTSYTGRMVDEIKCILTSGHGDYLIETALKQLQWEGITVKLRGTLGPSLSRCAPAYAIAVLASEELSSESSDLSPCKNEL
ncbi:MAG: hydantoinase/oxoprolinase family protein [Pirellula sp.]